MSDWESNSQSQTAERRLRIREVLLAVQQRRNLGEDVVDEWVISQHADLMPELEEDLQLLGILELDQAQDGAKDANKKTETARGACGQLTVRCPHCCQPVEVFEDTALADMTCSQCGSHFSLARDHATWTSPRSMKLGKFELIERLGVGSFGAVWRARDTQLDRTVAVKIPRQGRLALGEVDQFLREARAAAQLHHPNIVTVHEIGRDDDTVFIVSDLVEGVPLSEWLIRQPPTFGQAAELCATIAEALHHAHMSGVVHRDLKPQNVMMACHDRFHPVDQHGSIVTFEESGRYDPVIMDFGLAKRDTSETSLTIDGQVLGTPAYMSPEQARGEGHQADGRSDLYSLGVMLYQLLTGEVPFRGTTRMVLYQVLHDDPRRPRSLNDRIPRDLETICLKSMAKEPGRRYATAIELAADLRRFLKGQPIRARRITQLERGWRWCVRNRMVSSLAGAFVLALMLGTAVASWQAHVANRQREIADTMAAEKARLLDIANLNLIQSGWEQGNHAQILELLEDLRPRWEDSFEWRFWKKQMHRELKTFYGHRSRVRGLAFSPDGDSIAAGCDDGTVRVWNLITGEERYPPLVHCDSETVAYSNDGQYILTTGKDNDVVCWDAVTGSEQWRIPTEVKLRSACFSPNGTRIVTGGADGIVRVFDVESRKQLFVMEEPHSGEVVSVAYSPDRTKIVTAAFSDNTARIWNADDGRLWLPLKHNRALSCAAFSPNGMQVVAGERETVGASKFQAAVWEVSTGTRVCTVEGHKYNILGVDFSPNGQYVATAGWDGTAKVWDARTGKQLHSLKGHLDGIWSVRFHPADDRLVATTSWDGTVKLWDLSDQPDPVVFKPGSEITTADFGPDGQWAAIGNDSVRVIDLNTGVERFSFARDVSTVNVSPDGRWILTGGQNGTLEIWDSRTGSRLDGWAGDPRPISRIAVSQDNRMIVTGDHDGKATVWETRNKTELVSVQYHSARIRAIAISPDHSKVLTSGGDSIVMWDTTGRELHRLPCDRGNAAHSLAFSPNGKRVAVISGRRSVTCWDVTTSPWQPTAHFKGELGHISDISFCSQARRILTSNWDGTVRLWDAGTGRGIISLESPGRPFLHQARMSTDGRRIVAKDSHNIYVWTAATNQQISVWQVEDRKLTENIQYP